MAKFYFDIFCTSISPSAEVVLADSNDRSCKILTKLFRIVFPAFLGPRLAYVTHMPADRTVGYGNGDKPTSNEMRALGHWDMGQQRAGQEAGVVAGTTFLFFVTFIG